MAKKNESAAAAVNAENEMFENANIGDVSEADIAALGFEEVDPLKGLDAAYSAGQPGFEAGTTKLGIFKGTKTCISTFAKKPRWKLVEGEKKGPAARVQKKLHIFQAVTVGGEILKKTYGLWHAGVLSAMLEKVAPEQTLAVTYLGLAEKPFKEGDNAPHVFKLRGKDLEVTMESLTGQVDTQEDDIDLTPEQIASLQAARAAHNGQGVAARV